MFAGVGFAAAGAGVDAVGAIGDDDGVADACVLVDVEVGGKVGAAVGGELW